MLSHLAVMLVALAALAKGADLLVEYSSRVAHRFHVSDLMVGLLITSVGTSLPELAASLAASLSGSGGLAVGNVVGSNIANIGLVIGVAAIIRPFATEQRMHDRDGFVVVASAAALFGLVLDNRVGRLDAGLFLIIYVAYTAFAVRTDREGVEHRFKDFLKFVFDFEYAAPVARRIARRARRGRKADAKAGTQDADPREGREPEAAPSESDERDMRGVGREVATSALSLAAVIVGARYVVSEAVWLADLFGVPENLVGLSLIAVGTSLPELLVAVTAARKGNTELIVGNVLGSNIANVLLILGVSGLARPLDVSELSVVYTIPIMLFFSIAFLHFIRSDWRVSRRQGLLAVSAYVVFLAAAFVQGWG